MPMFGTLDSAQQLHRAAQVSQLFSSADEFEIPSADVLTLTFEIDTSAGQRAVPKALHPSLPSYAQIIVRHYRSGAWDECRSAELRINARAGTNYLGYCVGMVVEGQAALSALRSLYGARAIAGNVVFDRRYYGTIVSARADGATLLDAQVTDLLPINGKDVLFTPNVNLALVGNDAQLVHQEMEYTIRHAERGVAQLNGFEASAFGDANVILRGALPATLVTADVKYTAVRYLIDPNQPAMSGTKSVSAD